MLYRFAGPAKPAGTGRRGPACSKRRANFTCPRPVKQAGPGHFLFGRVRACHPSEARISLRLRALDRAATHPAREKGVTMLHATEVIGAAAYDSVGNYVGRVKEMFIEPADQPNRVAQAAARPRPIPPARSPLRPNPLRRSRQNQSHHRRIRARTLPTQRSLASRRQRSPRPANHRHQRPQSSPRKRY